MKKLKINEPFLIISPNCIWNSFGNTTIVLYSIKEKKGEEPSFYELDKTGSIIWQIIAEKSPSEKELILEAKKKFKKIGKNFEKDIKTFVQELKKNNVVVCSGKKRRSEGINF